MRNNPQSAIRNPQCLCRGQAIVEYAILFGIVTAALLGMQVFAKRGLQAGVKMAADRLSPQSNDPNGEQAQLLGMSYEAGQKQDEPLPDTTFVGQFLTKLSAVRTTTVRGGAATPATTQVTPGGGVVTTANETTTRTGALALVGGSGGESSYTEIIVGVHE